MEVHNFLVYQVRKADGCFRFIITDIQELAEQNLYRDEYITDVGRLEGILGGDVQFIIRENTVCGCSELQKTK